MAFLSACSNQWYFSPSVRLWRASSSAPTRRGRPLYPTERISFAGPTITAPTFRLLSSLQDATRLHSATNRRSHLVIETGASVFISRGEPCHDCRGQDS